MEEEKVSVPKYIKDVPWYYTKSASDDPLEHHKGVGAVDYSAPQAGAGIADEFEVVDGHQIRKGAADWDSKRDRWHGYSSHEWDDVLAKWDALKKLKNSADQETSNDSDDTDYELELEELGLDRKSIRCNHKEGKMEQAIRDRRSVPAYIQAINGNVGGKIRLGKDLVRSITNSDSDFVSQTDVADFKKVQKFAWDENKKIETANQRQMLAQHMANPMGEITAAPVDLGLNLEASPTLVQLRAKEHDRKKKAESALKRRKLMERYG